MGDRVVDDGHIVPIHGEIPVSQGAHEAGLASTGIGLGRGADAVRLAVGHVVVDDIGSLRDDIVEAGPRILDGGGLALLVQRGLGVHLAHGGIRDVEIVGPGVAQRDESLLQEVIPRLRIEPCRRGAQVADAGQLIVGRHDALISSVQVIVAAGQEQQGCQEIDDMLFHTYMFLECCFYTEYHGTGSRHTAGIHTIHQHALARHGVLAVLRANLRVVTGIAGDGGYVLDVSREP